MPKRDAVAPNEAQARFLTVQLVNQNPHLADLLVTQQVAGCSWVRILEVLRGASQDDFAPSSFDTP
jgi:hypothetical protein